jgi:hypothetical protein
MGAFVVQEFVRGLYASSVLMPPQQDPLEPPITYRMPFTAAAAKLARGADIGAAVDQVFIAGL